jgi:hypothetical protein
MRLTPKRINELRRIERYRHWLDQYALVELFRRKFGRLPRSKDRFPAHNRLGRWYHEGNRVAYRKGRMKRWQVHLLVKLGYVFELPDRWETNFEVLKRCWRDHPESWPYVYYYVPHLKRLEKWCTDQRAYYAGGTLSKERIRKLNSIRFTWDPPGDVVWKGHYDAYVRWTAGHRNRPTRQSSNRQERFLANWIDKERSKMNHNRLPANRARLIRAINRAGRYRPRRPDWEGVRQAYETWYQQHGARPAKYAAATNERRLGQWMSRQNALLHKGLMPRQRVKPFLAVKKSVGYPEKGTH